MGGEIYIYIYIKSDKIIVHYTFNTWVRFIVTVDIKSLFCCDMISDTLAEEA